MLRVNVMKTSGRSAEIEAIGEIVGANIGRIERRKTENVFGEL